MLIEINAVDITKAFIILTLDRNKYKFYTIKFTMRNILDLRKKFNLKIKIFE